MYLLLACKWIQERGLEQLFDATMTYIFWIWWKLHLPIQKSQKKNLQTKNHNENDQNTFQLNLFESVEVNHLQTNKEISFSMVMYVRTQWKISLNHEKGNFSDFLSTKS